MAKTLKCPKCRSKFVNAQAIYGAQEEKVKKGCLHYLLFGWVDIIFFPFKLLFGRKKIIARTRTYAVCQNCGYRWEVKQ